MQRVFDQWRLAPIVALMFAVTALVATAAPGVAATLNVRQDVREISLPPPPTGPADPQPFCTPSTPDC